MGNFWGYGSALFSNKFLDDQTLAWGAVSRREGS